MKRYKWVVEFGIDETWVKDGFDLDDDRAHEMLCKELRFAYGHELSAKVLERPPAKEIEKAQGSSRNRHKKGYTHERIDPKTRRTI